MDDLFRGKLVRLSADEPEILGKAFTRWMRNSEYRRLLDSEPPSLWSAKNIKEWFEKGLEKKAPDEYFFTIHTLEDDQLIGFVSLWGILWNQLDAWVGIGIGEPEYWGKGYGTDGMRLALRYAFMELNLERVTLGVFAKNPRAIRSYEKAGFKLEGLERQTIHRDGKSEDVLYMGIMRQEYLAGQEYPADQEYPAQNGGGTIHDR
jgi:RimJ/RimL family protein N-acetyltransferase